MPNVILRIIYNRQFFRFLAFHACLALKSTKSANMNQKNLLVRTLKGHRKMQNFKLVSNPLKTLQKRSLAKNYRRKFSTQ